MHIEVIKWNWHTCCDADGMSTVPPESVYYYDSYIDALNAYNKDVDQLIETDATIYLANIIKMKRGKQ